MSNLRNFLQKNGALIALLGAAIMIGVSVDAGVHASRVQNDASCDTKLEHAFFDALKQDQNLQAESVVVLDAEDAANPGAIGDTHTFLLSGSLCMAVNRARVFKDERDKGAAAAKEKSVALFFDEENTHLVKTVPVANDRQRENDWLLLQWKLRDPLRTASKGADNDAWKDALSGADLVSGRRTVIIGIGDKDAKTPAAVSGQDVKLIVYSPWRVFTGALGLLLVAAGLVASNLDTGLLRDGSGRIENADPAKTTLSTFSLSKAQMGLWTFLSIGGFVLLWVVSGRSNDIMTGQMLTLLGIQGASGIAAVLMDDGKARIATSGNFFADVLSDGESISFHRFQMLAWNVILAAIFLWSIFSTLRFPNFADNLLILSGVANGLYLGFKWPEARKRTPPPQSSGSAT